MTRKLKKKEISFGWPDVEVPELEEAVHLYVVTKCPSKYILVDMETGQVYVGSDRDNPYMPYTKIWEEQKNIKAKGGE
jgi:hypothetical protein